MMALEVALVVIAPLQVLTGVGAHHRGQPLLLSVISGVVFPVTWVIRYLRDERPYAAH
jgi:hypothetical protein